MSGPGRTPLFIDTSAFYARFDDDDQDHEQASAVFDGIESGEFVYRPLYTSSYILAELSSLIQTRINTKEAIDKVGRIRDSAAINVLYPGESAFKNSYQHFMTYDDQDISLIDHMVYILASKWNVNHVFTFDGDFQTLGLMRVPEDVAIP